MLDTSFLDAYVTMNTQYRLYKGAWIFAHDPHLEQKLSENEKKTIFSRGGLMIRNCFDFDCGVNTSFWYVIKDSFGGMEELSSKMRNQVKKCYKTMRVQKISSETLLKFGYEVYVAATDNYKIKAVPPTRSEFELRINNAEENEYWACFDIETELMVGFCMNKVTKESCEYRTMKAIPEYQKKYAYYGLIYEMNRYYLEERRLKYVNDGARSISNHSNMQPFLIDKFNFRKAYCNLNIYYKWWFGFAVKTLFPLRKFIKNSKVRAILDMESMSKDNYVFHQ